MGMEPDSDARIISNKKLQIEIKPNLGALAGIEPFNIISLWHVLEHVPVLNQAIQQLYDLLAKEGTLLVAVPNSNSYDAAYFKEYWAAYDVPRHVHHFTPLSIEPLFRKHGFQLIEQRPMQYDALYIAMLSTRNQTGRIDYLRSIKTGFASNIEAKQTGDWSSITYLFKKVL